MLGGKNWIFRNWVMFVGFGLEICDVEYQRVADDGELEPLDRYEVLGYDSKWAAPRSVRRLKSKQDVLRMSDRLCRKLGPGTVIKAKTRCADRKHGWKPAMAGNQDLCSRDKSDKSQRHLTRPGEQRTPPSASEGSP